MKHFASVAALFAAASLVIAAAAGASSYPDRPLAPDDRVRQTTSATTSMRSADIAPDDRLLHRPGSDITVTPVVQRSSVGDSFDWADAGIGAAGMAGLALLSLGVALVLRRREQPAFS